MMNGYRRWIALTALTLLVASPLNALFSATKPTHANVKYDTKHERNVLDFWQAKSKKATPLVVYFHGGGFRGGDKKGLGRYRVLEPFLDSGVSVAACNYPFLEDATYSEILEHCGRSIQFLRSRSKDWNIDPKRIGAFGGSAGALISEWLAYSNDMGGRKSKDPVARLSSKIAVAGGFWQPTGTERMVLRFMRKGGAPLFLYSNAPSSDQVHHPKYSRKIHATAERLKIPVVLYGGGKNDLPALPEGKDVVQAQLEFFCKHLKVKYKKR